MVNMSLKLTIPISEKFSEAILFILKNTPCSDMGYKKLAKLLYFADFNSYKKTYESITNEEYSRLEYGPLPKKLYPALEELKEQGYIEITDVGLGKNIKAIKELEPKHLSKEEQAEMLNVIKKIGALTGKQLENLSHKDTPWQVTDESDLISYDLVFYRDEAVIKQVE
jgi:uncharacterized phage-associated protein